MRNIIVLLLAAGAIGCSSNDGGSGAASLGGHWDLDSTYELATNTTTPFPDGAAVAHYHDGAVELYLNDGTTKGCGTSTYTLNGETITFADGSMATVAVTATTLRITNTTASGPPFNDQPGNHSDYTRLATFDTTGYGTCQ